MKLSKKLFTAIIFSILLAPIALYGQQNTGTLTGTIVDQQTGQPLGYSYVYISNLEMADAADQSGFFKFEDIEPGTYLIRATRVGYKTLKTKVTVKPGEIKSITLKMRPLTVNLNELTVTAQKPLAGSDIKGASKVLSGSKLRRNMSTTLAATLESIPGLATRSMGAAPARPVMRGLGGKRVIILQDGVRTGDVSSMSADHAVMVDPIGAEKIEIARGPAALKFGSNAVGGVINVVSHQIPASMPGHIQGNASLQGSTVNDGSAAALGLQIPVGRFAVQLNGNFRRAANLNTPVGEITNTGILSTDNTVGISYIRPWGYAGASFSYYYNHYGIPPDPHGGHKHGVDIKMRSYQFKGKSEILFHNELWHRLKIDLSYTNYYHKEIEPHGIAGTEFGLLTTTADISLHHGELGFIDEGTMGIWAEKTNLAVQGSQTPTTDSYSFSTYLVERATFDVLTVKGGLRFDYVMRDPKIYESNSSIGSIRDHTFAALSGSGSVIYSLNDALNAGIVLSYTFRAPSTVELYSEGPHIASYSYEVGNPDLDSERAFSKEIYFEFESARIKAKLSLYQNAFSNYIFPKNTGEQSTRYPTLNVYQYMDGEADFYGMEISLSIWINRYFQASGSLSYTLANLKVRPSNRAKYGKWRPLPKIPPLQSTLSLNYHNNGFKAGATSRIAAKQSRTGLFETSTSGYAVFDLFGQYQFRTGHTLHTISLTIKNIFNEGYYNHLSRIKEIMPEPGRNISLLYRVYF